MRGLPAEGTWRKLTRSRRRGCLSSAIGEGETARHGSAGWWRGSPGGAGMERSGFGGLYRANPATGSRLCEALGAGIVREEICLSRFFLREKQERPGDYYFLLPACLTDTASFFFWAALSALDFCCVDFFWLDFGDLSPIILLLFCVLTGLRHD